MRMSVPSTDLFGDLKSRVNDRDVVFTPDRFAADIVAFFKPSGRVLEPCKGDGVFLRYMPSAEWCEIREGRDFFGWTEPVDWIVTNPPYSIFRDFFRHAITIADNIVVLMPVAKHLTSWPIIRLAREHGGLRHIRYMGAGHDMGFPFGFPVAAHWYCRGWSGDISVSYYTQHTGQSGRSADTFEGAL